MGGVKTPRKIETRPVKGCKNLLVESAVIQYNRGNWVPLLFMQPVRWGHGIVRHRASVHGGKFFLCLWSRRNLKLKDIGYGLSWIRMGSARFIWPRYAADEWISLRLWTHIFEENWSGALLYSDPTTIPSKGNDNDDGHEGGLSVIRPFFLHL